MFWRRKPKKKPEAASQLWLGSKSFHQNPDRAWQHYSNAASGELEALIYAKSTNSVSTSDTWSSAADQLEEEYRSSNRSFSYQLPEGINTVVFFTPEGVNRVPFSHWAPDYIDTARLSSYYQGGHAQAAKRRKSPVLHPLLGCYFNSNTPANSPRTKLV